MKKIILIAMALISIEGIAQQRMDRPNRKDIAQKMFTLTPEETAGLETKRMTLHLGLNDFQQNEIYKLNLENATKRKSIMEANKAKEESGEIEKPTKEAYLSRMNARLDDQIATKIKMNFILDTEQRAKWEEIQTEMRHRFDIERIITKQFAQNNRNFSKRRF